MLGRGSGLSAAFVGAATDVMRRTIAETRITKCKLQIANSSHPPKEALGGRGQFGIWNLEFGIDEDRPDLIKPPVIHA
jgi:hypothetical protein